MFTTLFPFILASFLAFSPLPISLPADVRVGVEESSGLVLSQKTLSLTNRQPDPWVNEVFADLYEQFRGPYLVGLKIVSIQNCQVKELQAA